ncbi:MAG: TolC family protein [bacterium]|jgi:outer membrane protein TolC
MRVILLGFTLCVIVLSYAACRADELDELVSLAFSNSPTLQAAREGSRQAEAACAATAEFLDPKTTATAGRLSGNAAAPLLASPAGIPAADAYGAAAAVEVPFRPGIYAGIGASEQYLINPIAGLDSGYRTLVGAQIRIPLLQDRGFSLWRQSQARQKELQAAAEARLLETRQAVRHAVEQAYLTYLVEIANAATSESATDRSQQLLKEAEELVRLKVVPEYQLAPARLELALRREEIYAANQAIDTARLRLEQILGVPPPELLTTNSNALITRITNLHIPEISATSSSFATRGAISEIEALSAAASAETRTLTDRLRPELGLSLRGVWATEDSSSAAANDGAGISGEDSSVAAVLVWTRPWSQTGAHARLREARAREAQLAEVLHEVQNRLSADKAAAHREFTGSGERLKEITIAVDQARRTLEAEAERFRLGEGRSRNVLDAQNDLTKAYRARNTIVAALLKAHSDFMFATGYQPDNNLAAELPPLGGTPGGH